MIRFALSVYLTSPAANETARDTGIIKRPSNRTLFDYSHAEPHRDGIDDLVLSSIAEKVEDLAKSDRFHV